MNKKTVPVFFAADEKYMPYLAVALTSLKAYKSTEYDYQIHVLYTGSLNGYAQKVKALAEENLTVSFVDVSEKMQRIFDCIHCRDYYTPAIYYRLMIPEMFPEYDKALYMDCDTVLLADIAELYTIDIGDNYIGAVADQAVAAVPAFVEYTKKALGIDAERYFNSGVIVMNLKKFREIDFYDKFNAVLRSYDFTVAPDQDCLNLICKDKVYYFDGAWNAMPIAGAEGGKPKLIHYNLAMKPWHYDGVLYEEYFWAFAKQTTFLEIIQREKETFTPEMALLDTEGSKKLVALAQAEADNPHNFIRSVGLPFYRIKGKKEGGKYGNSEYFA